MCVRIERRREFGRHSRVRGASVGLGDGEEDGARSRVDGVADELAEMRKETRSRIDGRVVGHHGMWCHMDFIFPQPPWLGGEEIQGEPQGTF